MPYPNEHAARISNPNNFEQSSFRRKEITAGVDIIVGKLKGETKTTTQAYRFKKSKFTVQQAKEWLKEHNIKYTTFEPAKQGDEMDKKCKKDSVYRFDVMDDTKYFLTEPFSKTEDGFLNGRAIVTNIGVFPYKMKDGSIINELRLPEEVLNPKSLDTLKMLPVTNNHPKELVNIDNIKELQVGMTGTDIVADSYAVSVPIKITDIKTIEDVQGGKISLSCGYTADLEFSEGNWMGVKYNAIQRNIRYNHIAVVDSARAGDLARMNLRMDSSDAILDESLESILHHGCDAGENKSNEKKEDLMPDTLKIIKLDNGVEYSADEKVIESYTELQKTNTNSVNKIDELNTTISTITADRDTLKDKLDAAEKEVQKLKESQMDESKLFEAVKERTSLIDTAKKAEVEIKEDSSNLEIKKAVISKVFPNANLQDKDDVYISARYDSAIELLAEKKQKEDTAEQNNIENKKKVIGDSQHNQEQNVPKSYQERYDEYCKQLSNNIKEGGK